MKKLLAATALALTLSIPAAIAQTTTTETPPAAETQPAPAPDASTAPAPDTSNAPDATTAPAPDAAAPQPDTAQDSTTTTPPVDSTAQDPSKTVPSDSTATDTTTTMPADSAAATGTGDVQWYTAEGNAMDQFRASQLIGTNVTNSAGESIGEINDVLLSKDGKIAAAIIGVGGFLGIGEREVAVAFESLNMTRDANGNNVIAVNATRDALTNAPAWTWNAAPAQ